MVAVQAIKNRGAPSGCAPVSSVSQIGLFAFAAAFFAAACFGSTAFFAATAFFIFTHIKAP